MTILKKKLLVSFYLKKKPDEKKCFLWNILDYLDLYKYLSLCLSLNIFVVVGA